MKIYRETTLTGFDFWSGAKCRAEKLTYSELEQITEILEELYPDGIDETTVNDLFWFEEDTIAEWLGYNSFEEIYNRKEK